jgi:hypothetical protein
LPSYCLEKMILLPNSTGQRYIYSCSLLWNGILIHFSHCPW